MLLKQRKITPFVNPITPSLQGKEKRDQLRKERQNQPNDEPKKQPKLMVSIPLKDDKTGDKAKDANRKLLPILKKPKKDIN